MKNLTLAYWTLKYNLSPETKLEKAPKHCLCSWSYVDENDIEIYKGVIDYYEPRNKHHGWWGVLRGPGYQKGKHPIHLVFIKKGLEAPNMEQIIAAQITIGNLIKSGVI